MGRAFGKDFAAVRIHDGADAQRYASQHGYRAYAVGQDVGFASGAWRPDTVEGEILLAHELAHTIQQRSVDARAPVRPGRADLESDADRSLASAARHLLGQGGTPTHKSAGGLHVQGCGEDPGVVTELEGLKSEVEAAAQATGPQGITARLMAGILRIEMANVAFFGCSDQKAARADEIEDMEDTISEVESGGSPDNDDRDDSIGLGQIRLDTAAMAMGKTEWIDKGANRKRRDNERIWDNFTDLPAADQRAVFERLRTESGNLQTMAELLSILKNRDHRFPDMTRGDFGSDRTAVEIVATEYNIGGTSTPAAAAKPTDYGEDVWANMRDDAVVKKFSNS